MGQYFHPSKEQVRAYLKRRLAEHSPPPNGQEIRRQLRSELSEAHKQKRPG